MNISAYAYRITLQCHCVALRAIIAKSSRGLFHFATTARRLDDDEKCLATPVTATWRGVTILRRKATKMTETTIPQDTADEHYAKKDVFASMRETFKTGRTMTTLETLETWRRQTPAVDFEIVDVAGDDLAVHLKDDDEDTFILVSSDVTRLFCVTDDGIVNHIEIRDDGSVTSSDTRGEYMQWRALAVAFLLRGK